MAPPGGGVRTSLANMAQAVTNRIRGQRADPAPPGKGAPILSYSFGGGANWAPGVGNTPDISQFAPVFQPSGGLFAPGLPLAPVERERTRAWDFSVGYNYIYTPRSFEPVSFHELRALGQGRPEYVKACCERTVRNSARTALNRLVITLEHPADSAVQSAGVFHECRQDGGALLGSGHLTSDVRHQTAGRYTTQPPSRSSTACRTGLQVVIWVTLAARSAASSGFIFA
jgi:hypothetical protein